MKFVHASFYPLSLEDLEDVKQIAPRHKPGGLWLAKGKKWLRAAEEMGFEPAPYLYEVTLKYRTFRQNGILVIDLKYEDEVRDLIREYGYNAKKEKPGSYVHGSIDWRKVAKEHNGVAFKNVRHGLDIWNRIDQTKEDGMVWMISLDVDSVCIWYPREIVKSITQI